MVLEHLARHLSHLQDLRPLDTGHRIEVDPQLVGMIEIARADRMRVEIDAARLIAHASPAGSRSTASLADVPRA